MRKKRKKTLCEEFLKSKNYYFDVFCLYDLPNLPGMNFILTKYFRRNY